MVEGRCLPPGAPTFPSCSPAGKPAVPASQGALSACRCPPSSVPSRGEGPVPRWASGATAHGRAAAKAMLGQAAVRLHADLRPVRTPAASVPCTPLYSPPCQYPSSASSDRRPLPALPKHTDPFVPRALVPQQGLIAFSFSTSLPLDIPFPLESSPHSPPFFFRFSLF